jgi:plasmid stability protein
VSVPTLHIRGVPVALYERLRRGAAAHGRSLNAEVVAVLDEATGQRSWGEVFASIDARAERLGLRDVRPEPDELVREDRDSR